MLHLRCGISARVVVLLFCVNCQLLQRWSFCFWVCLSSFNNSASGYICHESVMMDQKIWDLLASVLFFRFQFKNRVQVSALVSEPDLIGNSVLILDSILVWFWVIGIDNSNQPNQVISQHWFYPWYRCRCFTRTLVALFFILHFNFLSCTYLLHEVSQVYHSYHTTFSSNTCSGIIP